MFLQIHRLRLLMILGTLLVCMVNSLLAVQCGLCKKNLTGKYLRIGPLVVHPDCFKCKQCDKSIDKTYRNESNNFFHPECYREKRGLVCAHCNKVLGQTWITSTGKNYHEECYRKFIQPKCAHCKLPISQQFAEDGGNKYHIHCYKNNKLPKCSYCSKPLEGVHLKDSWGNHYHEHHNGAKTPTCFSCNRVISKKTSNGGVRLNDGRTLCSYCNKYAIVRPSQVLQHHHAATARLQKVGITGIPKNIKIQLVDQKELARLTNGLSYHIKGGMRGLTVSEETLVGKKRTGTQHVIYLLQHMATLELEGVLAHELIHVWLFENHIKLTPSETEGLCNLGNYLTYSQNPSPMAKHFLETLNKDKDPIYGDGYRKMKAQLDQLGWQNLLALILSRAK
jgi:hypothetical protein